MQKCFNKNFDHSPGIYNFPGKIQFYWPIITTQFQATRMFQELSTDELYEIVQFLPKLCIPNFLLVNKQCYQVFQKKKIFLNLKLLRFKKLKSFG